MKVRIKSTGEVIEVYKSKERGTLIDADDCTTEYQTTEVEILEK